MKLRLLVFGILSIPQLLRAEVPAGTAAMVNGQAISSTELNRQTRSLLLTHRYPGLTFAKMRERALESMIDRDLLIQAFYKTGACIPDGYVDDRLENIVKEDFGGNRSRFEEILQARGISKESYRQEIADNFIIDRMRANHAPGWTSSLRKSAQIEIFAP